MVGRITGAVQQWYRDTTEKTVLSSPWVGYATGYAVRCFWTITLILTWCLLKWNYLPVYGFDSKQVIQKKTQELWLRTLAMWYCWAGTVWSLLGGQWRELPGTFLYSAGLSLSFELAQADYLAFVTPGAFENMAVLAIVAHSNVHPLSLMCIPGLRLFSDRFWAEWASGKSYFGTSTMIYDYCSQFLLLFSFTQSFTLRVREVSKGLRPSEEAKDILRGRSSRSCIWLIGLASWLQCWIVSLFRIWRMDHRFYSFCSDQEPLLNWSFVLTCPGAFLLALSCRNYGRWPSDFALASFCSLPQLWLYGEWQLLNNHVSEKRQIFFWDFYEELFELRWFQCLICTQALIQAGSHPLLVLLGSVLSFFLPDAKEAYQNGEGKLLARLVLLACLLTNHTVDFYFRDSALRDLPSEVDEVEMADNPPERSA